MYKITLNDGTILENLELNGNNYISKEKISESVFTAKALKRVEVLDEESGLAEVLNDTMLIQLMETNGEYWFILAEKPSYVRHEEEMKERVDAAEEAITELYEMMLEG